MENKTLKQYSKKQSQDKQSHVNYEALGRLLFALGETSKRNRDQLYRVAFIKGIWSGLGNAIGATIVISILIWLVTFIGSAPLISNFIEIVQNGVTKIN